MEFTRLTDAQRQSFAEDGFLHVPNALSPDEVEALLQASDKLAGPWLGKAHIQYKPWGNDLDLRPGLLYQDPLFDLVTCYTTVPLVVQLLSPNIHLHSTALTYKKPEAADLPPFHRGWHRDIRIPRDLGHEHLPLVGIKICYCLTDFDPPGSGMTLMARKSHLAQSPMRLPAEGIDPVEYEACDIPMKAGDALLFENRIYHTATPSRQGKITKRLIYGYSYRWMKPEVYLDIPDPDLLAKADPVMYQLLGGYRDIDTRPWAMNDWAEKNGVLAPPVPWVVRDLPENQ